MATDRTPTLPNAYGGKIPYQCDSLSLLDVLCENEFEGNTINQTDAAMAEVNFYKGAPPQWLNFYLAEREAAVDSTFIKRDAYHYLKRLIQSKRKSPGSIAIVKLLHQPSSGGSTLAMQVLWDLRKKHRCAVLKESTGANSTAIADQVINLFKAGDSQNTVLLLLEDENMADCLMREIAERKITSKVPVLIMLNCVRKSFIAEQDDPTIRTSVILRRQLSKEEKDKFSNKLDEIRMRYAQQHTQFHGLNIMCGKFSETYIQDSVKACVNKHLSKPRNLLLPFLALLNFYVPGSYLLESECAEFPDARSQDFESGMHPFNDLIVTFSGQEEGDKRVRMKHPMIADWCVKLLAKFRVTRGDTTRDFLKYFCKAEVPQHLVHVIKDMLTKREITVDDRQNAEEETQGPFSKLIQDIKKYERLGMCELILKEAVDTFGTNPFFPQTLARLYYREMADYKKAEDLALKAKERAPNNSFIADTLGQVHKCNLRNKIGHTPCPPAWEILEIAGKAIIAFKEEEKAAEKEVELESNSFNDRGSFGYLQVANYLFEALTMLDNRWKDILTGKNKTSYVVDEFPGGQLNKYLLLIAKLKDGVKKRYEFFEKYLTYSKPKIVKQEPGYFHNDVISCYQKYTGMMPISFPGLLSCLDRKKIDPDLQWMEQHFRTINGEKRSDAQATQNYILVNILLSQEGVIRETKTILLQNLQDMLKKYVRKQQIDQPTEFHLLALLLFWPEGGATYDFPYEQTVDLLTRSFEWDLSKYFHFRYLVPLFLLGKGQGLSRLVHKSRVDIMITEQHMNNLSPKQKNRKLGKLWSSGKIWELEAIKKCLLRIRGVVKQHEVFLNVADNRIKIFPDQMASIRNPGHVSFYLGFNIRGPVAFNIKYEAK
uniref:Sterile alpha motif domain-containing protein 9-like n=1 Tax=Hucho hucho TaxID=62062 RepID=A0A4W5JEU3_9TELE